MRTKMENCQKWQTEINKKNKEIILDVIELITEDGLYLITEDDKQLITDDSD